MDFVSTSLVTLTQPSGFWVSILNAFKGGTGSYILAVILVAIIVRVLFSLVDIINKKMTMKNNVVMARMKPELDAIQKKYGYDQKVLSQKQNEVYKKYQFNMVGSCIPMLIAMVLQMVVFLTLWNSLQAVANYNVVEKYENLKNIYANVVSLNESNLDTLVSYNSGDTLEVSIDFENKKMKITNVTDNACIEKDFKTDYSNEEIYNNLIQKYVNKGTDEEQNENYASSADEYFVTLAQETVQKYYNDTQEGFLWIKNIYKSESPTSPMFSESDVTNYLSNYYTDEEKTLEEANGYESKIFSYVITDTFENKDLGLNGYYILTILAVVVSFLSMWLSNRLMRAKGSPNQSSNKMMYFIMPIIMGIFTFMYTSLFAIYIIVGQIVMIALTPLTTLIVRKWNEHDNKKQKDKDIVEVDYRRKDI